MKVLLIGQGPLPIEGSEKNNAPGFRVWHFGRALAEAGNQVRLVGLNPDPTFTTQSPRQLQTNLLYYPTSEVDITQNDFLAKLITEDKPDALVGASVWPSYLAALYLPQDIPFWADLFGSPLAEAQAKAALYNDDTLIEPFARFEQTVLGRADIFSTVSTPQQYALVGELAMLGRLTAVTYGYHFAYAIPAATDETVRPHTQTVLRGKVVPENAVVVLWSGGYNTWTDVDTLFQGLEGAMAQVPELHFVSTGGGLPPHDSATYPHFCQLVESSPYRERFHLLGWLPYETVHNYYYEANLGIILDKWSYEGELGSRTRLVDWLKYGLSAVVTVTAEVTAELVAAGAAFAFPHGDTEALAALLIDLANDPSRVKQAAEQGQNLVLEKYHYKVACAPLVEWVASPKRAPDAALVKPLRAGLVDTELQKQFASLTSQIAQKNSHIAELEKWAQELQATLNNKNNSSLTRNIRQFIQNKTKKQE